MCEKVERKQGFVSVDYPRFTIGDRVRIVRKKDMFSKANVPRWNDFVYVVHKVLNTRPPTYKIEKSNGGAMAAMFSDADLQWISPDQLAVEKILRYRTKNGNGEQLVKWKGFDKKYNSWIAVPSEGETTLV